MINFLSIIFNNNKGLPLILKKGPENNKSKSTQLYFVFRYGDSYEYIHRALTDEE